MQPAYSLISYLSDRCTGGLCIGDQCIGERVGVKLIYLSYHDGRIRHNTVYNSAQQIELFRTNIAE